MAYNIPQGASRDIVLKCWADADKTIPADLTGKDFTLLLKDSFGGAVLTYSTKELPDVSPIAVVGGGMLTVHLTKESTAHLKGKHHIEIKVSEADKADIDVIVDITFTPTIVGQNTQL